MRLPCPVGHYGLLSILGGSARPPSLLTPPLCGQTWHPATSIQYRVVTETVLRALRDLRAPLARYAFLGFLRHPVDSVVAYAVSHSCHRGEPKQHSGVIAFDFVPPGASSWGRRGSAA